MAIAPITHGSRMDHFYAVDSINGVTYIGHCEQTAQTTGLLNLIHYCAVPTSGLLSRQASENKDFGIVAAEVYLRAHSKISTVALSGECRVAIHILDDVLKQVEKKAPGQ
jgi:hypothetical protein